MKRFILAMLCGTLSGVVSCSSSDPGAISAYERREIGLGARSENEERERARRRSEDERSSAGRVDEHVSLDGGRTISSGNHSVTITKDY